jgi:hypothetical protein
MSTTMSQIWKGFQTPYGPKSLCGSTGRITSERRTNCIIASMSRSPIAPAKACNGFLNCRSAAIAPPTTTATIMLPTTK